MIDREDLQRGSPEDNPELPSKLANGRRGVNGEGGPVAEEIDFVGIASRETGNAMTMPTRHEVTDWTLAPDVGGRNRSGLSEALGARGMPLAAFYGENGELLRVQLGAVPEGRLRVIITDLYGLESRANQRSLPVTARRPTVRPRPLASRYDRTHQATPRHPFR